MGSTPVRRARAGFFLTAFFLADLGKMLSVDCVVAEARWCVAKDGAKRLVITLAYAPTRPNGGCSLFVLYSH
jgi:hypothetical protein